MKDECLQTRSFLCKRILAGIILMVMSVFYTGCADRTESEPQKSVEENSGEKKSYEEIEKLAEGYRDIYEKAEKQEKLHSLELQEEIVNYFGDLGYTAVDADDQINMVNYEAAERFCEKAQAGEKAQITIFAVMDEGSFARYDMDADKGKIDVTISSLQWKDDTPAGYYYHTFQAHSWKYTERGYLFIEEYHPDGYDGPHGKIGFRIKPLDQTCRDLNRKYVYPAGYVRNNLLITNWNEQDYSALEFYDLYELFYYMQYGAYVPYEAYNGAEYEIPKAEFEETIQYYLPADSEQIAENTVFDPDRQTYSYRPRGISDTEYPYQPYPEVVEYEEQDDGTIRLLVEAVWEIEMNDCAISSELAVRPLENGRFEYVSNHIVSSGNGSEAKWYTARAIR